jgi:hypothetical protein
MKHPKSPEIDPYGLSLAFSYRTTPHAQVTFHQSDLGRCRQRWVCDNDGGTVLLTGQGVQQITKGLCEIVVIRSF